MGRYFAMLGLLLEGCAFVPCDQNDARFGDFSVRGNRAILSRPLSRVSVSGDLVIPEKLGGCPVVKIEEGAFNGNNELRSVTIPASVTMIETDAFSDCAGLMSFDVDSDNPVYCSINGLLCSKDGRRVIAGVNGDVIVPSSVTRIADSAFCGCKGLKSVKLPAGLKSIGDSAFAGCDELRSVTLPSGLTTIEGCAFYECHGLSEISIPSTVTTVGELAFDSVPYFENLPDGMIVVGKCLYEMKGACPSAITIPSGVETISEAAFALISTLEAVTIPASVTAIGGSSFAGCDGLSTVYVASGDVERMKEMLSKGGVDVEKVTFKTMSAYAVRNCVGD